MTDLWRGRPVESLTREELIEALRTMAKLYRAVLDEHAHELRVLNGENTSDARAREVGAL